MASCMISHNLCQDWALTWMESRRKSSTSPRCLIISWASRLNFVSSFTFISNEVFNCCTWKYHTQNWQIKTFVHCPSFQVRFKLAPKKCPSLMPEGRTRKRKKGNEVHILTKGKYFPATWLKCKLLVIALDSPKQKSSWRRLISYTRPHNGFPFLKHLIVAMVDLFEIYFSYYERSSTYWFKFTYKC